ncbi:MAG TPA: hypothetical protein VNO32_37510 [Candidatus Acidoferrum sp.]|jgi:hypothetical protein|nr:hypothetical protein [Candidatus Acidoferrum sp.]
MPSPEIDALKAQMTAIIVRDAEGYFDDPSDREAIQITVRIACEFFMFVQQSSRTWPKEYQPQRTLCQGLARPTGPLIFSPTAAANARADRRNVLFIVSQHRQN